MPEILQGNESLPEFSQRSGMTSEIPQRKDSRAEKSREKKALLDFRSGTAERPAGHLRKFRPSYLVIIGMTADCVPLAALITYMLYYSTTLCFTLVTFKLSMSDSVKYCTSATVTNI